MKYFDGVRRVTINSSSDFGADPDHDADTGIIKRNFYNRGIGNVKLYLTRAEQPWRDLRLLLAYNVTGCTRQSFAWLILALVTIPPRDPVKNKSQKLKHFNF